MIKLRLFTLFLLLFSITGLHAQATEDQPREEDPEILEVMNRLAEVGLQTGIKALQESGGLYPFAMVTKESGRISMVGYQGDPESAPDPEKWSQALFMRLREMVKEDTEMLSAVLIRLHEVEADDGRRIPGLWANVDHREGRAWVVFMPLVPNDEGRHVPGDLIYYATEQPIFEH